jgi:competence protein ComEC
MINKAQGIFIPPLPCHNFIQMSNRLKKKIHTSWLIAWLSFGFLVGIALSIFSWSKAFTDSAWLVISASLFIFALIKHRAYFVFFALVAGLFFGLWRGALERQALANYQPYYGKNIAINGKVTQDTSYGPQGDQRIRLGYVKIGNQSLPEEIWVSTTSTIDIKRGDLLKIHGQLNQGFGNIPASMYRARIIKDTRPYPGDIGIRIRDKFAEGTKKAIPEPEASLGLGYLVGQSSTLPENLDQQIKTVGLTHAVVASGYNLTILVTFATGIFTKKSKFLAIFTSSLMISAFMLITGFSPSMSRAGLVSGLGLLAWYYGRKIHPLVLLPFAAAITVIIRPAYIWGDIGWYLSFTAFIGVIILAPLVHHYFWRASKKSHKIRQLFIETISAQLATGAIILLVFHQYSPYALIANLLVLPFVPFAMLFTFFAGLAGLFAPAIATWVGLPATFLLTYSIHVIGYIAGLPNAKTEIIFNVYELILAYAFLLLVVLYLWKITSHKFRDEPTLIEIR